MKITSPSRALCAAAVLTVIGSLTSATHAQTLARYAFPGGAGTPEPDKLANDGSHIGCVTPSQFQSEGGMSYAEDIPDSSYTASPFDASVTFDQAAEYYGWGVNSADPNVMDCIYFTVELDNSQIASGQISNLTFDVGAYDDGDGIQGFELIVMKGIDPASATVLSTSGQFTGSVTESAYANKYAAGATPWTGSSSQSFDLSSLSLDADAGSGTTSYVFAMIATGTQEFDGDPLGAGSYMTLDNVHLTGNIVCVPEPSSALFLGMSGLLMLRRRKRG